MTAAETPSEAAPAKVNLYLHLRGRRADGYHLLESLAVFPAIADQLTVEPGTGLSLAISGPFAGELVPESDNLVLRAGRTLAAAHGIAPNAALHLEKRLPVASGIGGGSSDAAAALRLLGRHWGVSIPEGVALGLGADVPVCLNAPRPQLMSGIGEELCPAPALPAFWMVLANPRVAVGTGAVFAAVKDRDNPPGPPPPAAGFPDFEALCGWLRQQRNDLQPAAVELCPPIGETLAALAQAPLSRMSGSGATCFALHADETAAMAQAEFLTRNRPGWWVAAAPVQPSQGA